MRNFKIIVVGLLSFLVFGVNNVKAETVEVGDAASLKTCSEASGNTCVLTKNIEVSDNIIIGTDKNTIVNLNSHNIAFEAGKFFYVQGGSLEVIGTGEIKEKIMHYSPILIKGNPENSSLKTKVTIGKDVTLNGWAGLFIDKGGDDSTPKNSNIEVVMNGKSYGNNDGSSDGFGIYINGVVKSKTNKVTLGETAVVDGKDGLGIYAAGYAEWDIKGATIKGKDAGIGAKSGIFNIKNAKISSSGEDSTPTQGFSNGINSSGAAIQIESNNNYVGDMQINIDGGTYTSEKGIVLYEYLAANTDKTKVASVNIKNANFVAGEGKRTILVSESFNGKITNFIESGTFSSDVTSYIKNTSIIRELSDNSYLVGTLYNVTIPDTFDGGTVTADKTSGIVKDEIKLTITPNEGYVLSKLTVKDASNNEISVTNNAFKLPNSNVTVSASFVKLEILAVDTNDEPTEEVIGVKNSDAASKIILNTLSQAEQSELRNGTTVSLNVNKIEKTEEDINKVTKALKDEKIKKAVLGSFFDITISIKKDGATIGYLTELKKSIELSVVLPKELKQVPSGYTRTYYIVRNHDGVAKVLNTKLSKDKKSLTFKSNKFSTYAIAYVDTKVVSLNPQTGDNILNNIALLAISILGFSTFSIVCFKNRREQN